MDCLPAGGVGDVRGPEDWDGAERAVRAFVGALAGQGMVGTLFVAPEALGRLRAALEEAAGAGCELGLLCHPQLAGYASYLGSYSFERQREILHQAREAWQDALGRAAETVRSGFFSANDHTFHAMVMEGFRQGSCSLPGRTDDEQCSIWRGSYPFPHHTDPLDRTAQGTMEFFEVPVTSDFEAASYLSYGSYTPPHLRIEEPDLHEYAQELVSRHLARMEGDGVPLKVVNFVTSNRVGWGLPEDPHVERLANLAAMLRELADRMGLRVRGAGVEGIHAAWDAVVRADASRLEEAG